MTIEIDLLTKELPEYCNVWRIFAGTRYKFLEDFISNNAIFIDFPGLELPSGDLNESEDFLARGLAAQEVVDVYKYMGPMLKFQLIVKNTLIQDAPLAGV